MSRLSDLLKMGGVPRCKAHCPKDGCGKRCARDDDHSGRDYCSKHGGF